MPGRRVRPRCCAAARESRFACVGMAVSWSTPPDKSGSTTSKRGAPRGVPPRSAAYQVPFTSVGRARASSRGRTASAAARDDSASQCASIKDLPGCEAHTRPATRAAALPLRPQREPRHASGRACEPCNHVSQPSAVRLRAWSSNRSVRSKPPVGSTPRVRRWRRLGRCLRRGMASRRRCDGATSRRRVGACRRRRARTLRNPSRTLWASGERRTLRPRAP